MKRTLLFFGFILAFNLNAQPGTLDTTFSGDGKLNIVMDGRGRATSIVVQPDSKIIVGGYSRFGNSRNEFALARFLANGDLDLSFNGTGKAFFDTANNDYYCTGIALQPNGKIVAAGFTNTDNGFAFAVVRFNADGTLDTAFGTNGLTSVNPGTTSFCDGMMLQPDGKIILIGHAFSGTTLSNEIVAIRFNANGQLDNSFGNNGIVTTTTGLGSTIATAIAIQPDGRIILVGETADNTTFRWNAIVVRYNIDGSLDSSFGQNGIVVSAFPLFDCSIKAVELEDDGKIVVAGYAGNGPSGNEILVLRYDSAGMLDTAFADDGVLITPLGSMSTSAEVSSMLLKDSKIILSGSANVNSGDHSFLTCFNNDGTRDTNFGTNGTTVSIFGEHDSINSLAFQSDGKIVTGGGALVNNSLEFTVARFNALPNLGLGDNPETNFGLLVYPNPLTQNSKLRFTLNETAEVSIVIYDALGRQLHSIVNDGFGTGMHEIRLNFADGLPNGIYHLVLSSALGKASLKLQK